MQNQTTYANSFKSISRRLNRVKIDELLEKADNSNELMISSSIPKFRTDLKAPDINTKRERTSEDDSISVLKVTLESLVVEDSDLKEYYDGLKSRLNQKKIDEIYSIISADIPFHNSKKSFTRSNTMAYPIKTNKHLTKKSSSIKNPRFEQKTLIDSDENDISAEVTDIATYVDEDFDIISEKIIKGEIKIEGEDINSSQLTFEGLSEIRDKEESDDINLKIAFDMINNDDDSSKETESSYDGLFSKLFKYRSVSHTENNSKIIEEEENEEYNGFEYESISDKPEAEKLLKNTLSLSLKKLVQSFLLFCGLFVLSFLFSQNGIFAHYLDYKVYAIPYILVETQLLFLGVAVHKGEFLKGLSSFTTGKFTSDSVFTTTVLFITIHNVFALFNADQKIVLFNSIPILMSLFMSLGTYLRNKNNIYSFRIISSDEEKYVAAELSPTSKEASSFYSYLSEDSDVYTVSKTNFVSSFFKRISKRPKSEDILFVIIPAIFFVSAIIFSICFFHGKMGVYSSFSAATAFVASSMPITSVFVITLPIILANKNCHKIDSAIIGDTVAEDYSTASVISFEDTELFPESKVVMTNMKVYHNMRLDQIIVELAKLFSHLGGPLKGLFSKAVDGVFEEHAVIKVIESAENGIMIAADGVDYYLGNADFIRKHSLSYEDDNDDKLYEKNGGSVMIFGANRVVAAKFYFKYTPQKGFKKLLNHMYNCGLCIGIKTLDPNINNNLLAYHADGSSCPISILKSSSPEELESKHEKVDTGIVSKRSLGAFLKTFMLCDKARHSIKSNGIIMLSGTFLTAIMMIFISITGGISDYTSNHAFFFQILWSIAIFILSFLK